MCDSPYLYRFAEVMRKIRFATIGSNFIVDSFLRGAAHEERFEYAAVYSRNEDRAREFAQRYGVDKIYTSLESLACDKDIDAVYIASPNVCHASQAIMMMEYGKNVLCEKPLAPSYAEVLSMVETARRHGVTLLEAMKTTLLPNFFAVRDALPKIGKVRRFFAQFCQYSSRYDSFREGILLNAFNPEMKGGALLDLGVYGVAPLVHLFGMPTKVQSSETELSTQAGLYVGARLPSETGSVPEAGLHSQSVASASPRLDAGNGIDGQGTLLLTYPEMEGVIMYSKISDSSLPSEIQGEEGRIIIDKLSQMTNPHIEYRDGCSENISVPTIEDNMYYEIREFIDLILAGQIESSENTFERSLQVARIVSC